MKFKNSKRLEELIEGGGNYNNYCLTCEKPREFYLTSIAESEEFNRFNLITYTCGDCDQQIQFYMKR